MPEYSMLGLLAEATAQPARRSSMGQCVTRPDVMQPYGFCVMPTASALHSTAGAG